MDAKIRARCAIRPPGGAKFKTASSASKVCVHGYNMLGIMFSALLYYCTITFTRFNAMSCSLSCFHACFLHIYPRTFCSCLSSSRPYVLCLFVYPGFEIYPRWPYMAQSVVQLTTLRSSVASLVPGWTRDTSALPLLPVCPLSLIDETRGDFGALGTGAV